VTNTPQNPLPVEKLYDFEKLNIETELDKIQGILDVGGLVPLIGEPIDALNTIISVIRGDKVGAALGVGAMIPFAGWGSAAGKWGRRVMHMADDGANIAGGAAKHADTGKQVVSTVVKRFDVPKPKYTVHPDRLNPNYKKGIKTPLPDDAEEVFKHAIPGTNDAATHWWGKNAKGEIYKFHNSNDGTAHFSEIIDMKSSRVKIPDIVKERLGL
jgi:hypothetical protein